MSQHRIDWRELQSIFAAGSPVLAIGPGCHRIGYDNVEEWQRVVTRLCLVWHQLGARGETDEDAEARREFLTRFWASHLRRGGVDPGSGSAHAPQLPQDLEICDRKVDGPRREHARIALATDLFCALTEATRLLGTTVASGAVPVTDWQLVGAPGDDGDGEDRALLRKKTVHWLERAREIAADLKAVQLDMGWSNQFPALAERGLDADDAREDKLPLLKAEAIHAGLTDLLRQRFETADQRFSGAVVEWLSDLFWHVIVSGAGVPPSQDELSFYLNLHAADDDAMRRFSRPHPGEYRGPEDGGETLRDELGALLADYDSGVGEFERDWTRRREAFALAMAASLREIWRTEQDGLYSVALVSDYDLMLERALLELMDDGQAFHVIAPAVVNPGSDRKRASFKWLFGTVEKGADGPGGRIECPRWQWLGDVPSAEGASQGPILIRLTGSPLFEMGDLAELGLYAPEGQQGMTSLDAAAVFSEHDSVQAVMELTRTFPSGSGGSFPLIQHLVGPMGLTWEGRAWLFFGHKFSDWLPRLQLLFTALMLAQSPSSIPNASNRLPGQTAWGGKPAPPPKKQAVKTAIARSFDWPEQALLSALGIEMREVDLDEVSRYFCKDLAHADAQRQSFLQSVRAAVEEKEPPEAMTATNGTEGARAAPSVFISYSREGEDLHSEWNCKVKAFADALSRAGLTVRFDQYGNPLNRDWSTWGPQAVEGAEHVICVASPGFAEKWWESAGSGVANEARTIRRALDAYELKGLLFVVLPGRSRQDIPNDMRDRHYEVVHKIDNDGIEDIVRLLTDQPARIRPDGKIPELPPR